VALPDSFTVVFLGLMAVGGLALLYVVLKPLLFPDIED
jgi:hypothetical protein